MIRKSDIITFALAFAFGCEDKTGSQVELSPVGKVTAIATKPVLDDIYKQVIKDSVDKYEMAKAAGSKNGHMRPSDERLRRLPSNER